MYRIVKKILRIFTDVNWPMIITLAVFFAFGESLALAVFQNEHTLPYFGFLPQVLKFSLYILLWILPLWAYFLIIKAIKGINIRIKLLFCVIPVAMLTLYFISIFCEWYFYFKGGYFLDRELIIFGLRNFMMLQLHFLQSVPGVIVFINLTAVTVSVIVTASFYKNFRLPLRLRPSFQKLFIAAILLSAFLCVFKTNPDNLAQRTHPLLTYAITPDIKSPIEKSAEAVSPDIIYPLKTTPYYFSYNVNTPVIVIVIESLRRDLISMDSCPIPFMKSLTEEGIIFDKAYATSSHSDYADLSIWYSQYPLRTFNERQKYDRDDPWRGVSAFKVFKELGYKTGYITSQNEKWHNMIEWLKLPEVDYFYHSEDYDGETWHNKDNTGGLRKLLEEKLITAGKIEDSATLNIAKNWIESLGQKDRFFLGMNLQNTHYNYVIPEGGEEPFQPSVIDFTTIYAFWPKEKTVDVRNRYLNAAYNIDKALRGFVGFLKRQDIWENCIFVILGDSGEAFYEHGIGNHTGAMYDEVARTFCFIKPPHYKTPDIIEKPVSHIDIIPTILDLLNVPEPSSFQGLPAFGEDKRKAIYMHSNAFIRQYGILIWPWKLLITSSPEGAIELYNLENDEREKVNLYGKPAYKAEGEKLLKKLIEWKDAQLTYYRKSEKPLYMMFSPPRYLDLRR